MKKFRMLLIAFTIMLFMGIVNVYATEETKPPVSGVQVSADGIITFDDFEGADTYWLGLEQGFLPVAAGDSIVSRIETICTSEFEGGLCGTNNAGRYFLQIDAAKEGYPISSYYYGWLDYDGTTFSLTEADGNYSILVYDSNGGTPVEKAFVKDGSPFIRPTAPTKEGTTFLGWYLDEELTQKCNFDSLDRWYARLYAKWGNPIGIPEVEVRGITVPVAGEHPVTTGIEIVTSGLTATWAEWFEDEEGGSALTSTDTFKAGKRYYLLFRATPDEGYEYTGDILIYPEDHVTATPEPIRYDHGHDGVEFEFYYETEAAPVVAPAVLTAPTVTISAKENAVTLNWDEQEGVTKAEVYRSENKKKWTKVGTVTTNSYTNKGLTYGKSYYYRVRLFNGTKWTGYSNIVGKKIVPSKVVNLKVASVGPTNIKVSWDKVNVNGYEVYMGTKKIATITKNGTITYNKTKLKANTTYKFKVRAYKKVGSKKVYGGWSDVLTAKTTPARPTLALSMRDLKEVNVVIGKVAGATSYVVERSLDGTTYEVVATLPTNGTLANAELETGTRYYYRVKACAGELCSPYTSANIVSTTKTPSFSLKTTSKKVEVTITPVAGATSYEVFRATSKKGKYTKVGTVLTEAEILSLVNGTKKGKTYYYRVRAAIALEEKTVYTPFSGIKSIRSK